MSGNGTHVTWRELNLSLDPIKTDVAEIKGDVKDIRDRMAAPGRWLGVRLTNIVDRALPLVIAVAGGYLIAHL